MDKANTERLLEFADYLDTLPWDTIRRQLMLPEHKGGFIPPSDTIPALLDPGVSYVSKETSERFGTELLKQINGGGEVEIIGEPKVSRHGFTPSKYCDNCHGTGDCDSIDGEPCHFCLSEAILKGEIDGTADGHKYEGGLPARRFADHWPGSSEFLGHFFGYDCYLVETGSPGGKSLAARYGDRDFEYASTDANGFLGQLKNRAIKISGERIPKPLPYQDYLFVNGKADLYSQAWVLSLAIRSLREQGGRT